MGGSVGEVHRTSVLDLGDLIGLARKQLSKALGVLDCGGADDRDGAIHEVRKRIKKARALIQLARGAVGRKAIERANRQLRDAGRPLSAARDAAVLIQALDDLADRDDNLVPPGLIAEVREALVAHRREVVGEKIGEGDGLARVARAIRATRRLLADWKFEDGVEPSYKRSYRRGRDWLKSASDDPSPESLHEFRKRVKTFKDQLSTSGADPQGPVGRLQRLAGLLSEELGRVHDLDILREFIQAQEGFSSLLGPLDRRRLALRREALVRAKVVFLDKPRVFHELLTVTETAES
jgi:CHAD domain-containing protein